MTDIPEPKEDRIDDKDKQQPGVHPDLVTGNDDEDDVQIDNPQTSTEPTDTGETEPEEE